MERKKLLVARTLKVGAGRILFNKERLDEIKNAITKDDVKELVKDKAVIIKEIKGRKKNSKPKRRRIGSIKKKIKNRKEDYMILTRKLRSFLSELKKKGKITNEEYLKFRKQIRARSFKSKGHMKEIIENVVRERQEAKK